MPREAKRAPLSRPYPHSWPAVRYTSREADACVTQRPPAERTRTRKWLPSSLSAVCTVPRRPHAGTPIAPATPNNANTPDARDVPAPMCGVARRQQLHTYASPDEDDTSDDAASWKKASEVSCLDVWAEPDSTYFRVWFANPDELSLIANR